MADEHGLLERIHGGAAGQLYPVVVMGEWRTGGELKAAQQRKGAGFRSGSESMDARPGNEIEVEKTTPKFSGGDA
jgi:hypothetical protein